VLLVAGGSGISHVLSLLDDLLAKHAQGHSRVRAIEVVWTVADPSSLTALLPTLRPLLRPRPSPHSALSISMTVHFTRAARSELPDPARLPIGLHVVPGRPNALRALEGTIDRVLAVSSRAAGAAPTSGVVAACCGPPALVEQVSGAVGDVSWARWRDVGGVESVSETFGW
jgi:ferric-chelate reductase